MLLSSRRKTLYSLLSLLPGLFLSGCGVFPVSYEQPKYQVVETFPDFELRRYEPYLVAETEVSGDFDEVGNRAFRILFDFIQGNNRRSEEISMTAPVNQVPAAGEGEKIPMTAPVVQEPGGGAEGTYLFSFVMPGEYTLETVPRPLDPQVRIREVPGRSMAARTYSGRWTEANYRENEAILLQGVREAGLQPAGPTVYARYNPPFTPWFLRRNEVLVPVGEPAPQAP